MIDALAQLYELANGAGLTFVTIGDTAVMVATEDGVETRVARKATLVEWKRTA